MINENFFCGLPDDFQNKCKIYPPTVGEVLETKEFPQYRKILTMSQEDIEDEFMEQKVDLKYLLTPYEYLLNNSFKNGMITKVISDAFKFFIHEPVILLPKQKKIIIGHAQEILKSEVKLEDLKFITEDDFFDFQNLIRQAVGDKVVERPQKDEDPRVHKMKAKSRYREKIKAKRAGEKKDAMSFSDSLISLCCMDMGINPLNIRDLTYASISPLIRRYQEKIKYQLDVDSLLAGADSKKIKPKSWMRNLED